ncbi:MAG: DUF4198 domain-containing protein [Deltaproteobacteria bacterium]|jgi:uncharacterized GH25 family protein|nr:DUF4198 domain-containing protein [Deltaproteobacteria bacterium]
MPRMERPLLPALLLVLLAAYPACAEYFAILRADPPLVSDDKCKALNISIAFGHPFGQTAVDMDLVQMFAAIKYPLELGGQTVRREFLDTLKPAKYLKKNSWAGTIPLPDPGLYQLVLETRPYWEEKQGIFLQQFAQTLIPVQGCEYGWEIPVGLKLEILPLTRPFGLTAPALFTGRVLLDGKSLSDTPVRIEYLNEDKRTLPSPHHQTQRVRTDERGAFSFVCPHPGWWGLAAVTQGDPLKGSDGKPKNTELSGVLWLYVDPPGTPKKKQAVRQDD